MHFSTIAVLLSLAASSLAAPAAEPNKRAAASVLKVQTYNAFSVSAGVAGNALAEVNAKFPVSHYLTIHICSLYLLLPPDPLVLSFAPRSSLAFHVAH